MPSCLLVWCLYTHVGIALVAYPVSSINNRCGGYRAGADNSGPSAITAIAEANLPPFNSSPSLHVDGDASSLNFHQRPMHTDRVSLHFLHCLRARVCLVCHVSRVLLHRAGFTVRRLTWVRKSQGKSPADWCRTTPSRRWRGEGLSYFATSR